MLDFLGLGPRGRIRITTISSKKDLERLALGIRDGKLRMLVLTPS